MKYSIIIPCYNEYNNLLVLLDKIKIILDQNKNLQIVIVNNGSTDDTSSLLKKYKMQNLKFVILKKNLGYGGGIKAGINSINTDIICWTHADEQVKIEDVVNILKKYEKNFHQTFFIKGKRKKRRIIDFLFTKLMSIFVFIICQIRLNDINGQPKIFHKNLKNYLIDNSPDDFSLDLHILLKYKNKYFNIDEENIDIYERKYDDAKGGGSFLGKLYLSLKTIKYILKYALKK